MARDIPLKLGSLIVVAALLGACGPQPTKPIDKSSFDFEGLRQFETKNFTAGFGRPGVDFTIYEGVIINDVRLAFRTPDRSQNQFALDEEQKTRFRELLEQSFVTEFANLQNIKVVEEPGPNVLDLHVRVQDITATMPGRRVGAMGSAAFALEAIAEATLVIELNDSQSEEVLVRAFDQRAVEGAAMFQDGQTVSRWQDVERLCQRWALRVREGLDVLVGEKY